MDESRFKELKELHKVVSASSDEAKVDQFIKLISEDISKRADALQMNLADMIMSIALLNLWCITLPDHREPMGVAKLLSYLIIKGTKEHQERTRLERLLELLGGREIEEALEKIMKKDVH